jgi:antirestriction protein ArdC
MNKQVSRPDWATLFESILSQPGRLGEHYHLFHRYSLGNQALAMAQMLDRNIPIGPISSFNGWKKLGRKVKKGEKAIGLWMPVIKKETREDDEGDEDKEVTKMFFIMKNNWFALAQTEPVDPENPGTVPDPKTPDWDRDLALQNLGLTEVPFESVEGNCQGYAMPNVGAVAVSPIAAFPEKTLFHEMAHCILHSKEALAAFVDDGNISYNIQEAEAESVAFLCCATLGLPGLDEARGYVQHYLRSSTQRAEFAKKAGRVFAAADKILKAGSVKSDEASQEGEVEHA